MTDGIDLTFRIVGIVVMTIGIGVFLFRKSEGAAELSVFKQKLSVSRESLVLFAIGALLFVFPNLNPDPRPLEVGSVSTEPIEKQTPATDLTPTLSPSTTSSSVESAPTIRNASASPPTGSTATGLTPAEIRQNWFNAVSSGDTDLIARMLASNVVSIHTPVDDEANTALHLAAERCDANLIRFLVDKGLNPERHNSWNDSPRAIAARRCRNNESVLSAF